jgi:hypothetical protein
VVNEVESPGKSLHARVHGASHAYNLEGESHPKEIFIGDFESKYFS